MTHRMSRREALRYVTTHACESCGSTEVDIYVCEVCGQWHKLVCRACGHTVKSHTSHEAEAQRRVNT